MLFIQKAREIKKNEAFGAMDDDAFTVPNSYFVVLVKPFVRETCDSSHECVLYGSIFVPCKSSIAQQVDIAVSSV